jgi:hypothetical protein
MAFQDDLHAAAASPDLWEETFREWLQQQIYSWIQMEIPGWQPEFSPKYLRNSQAMMAACPGDKNAPSGLVYFKSVFDPCWSDEDLARLRKAGYAWLFVILSPCERFYEFESRLSEIAAQFPQLVLWRPAAPAREEYEKLRKFLSESSNIAVEKEPFTYRTNPGVRQILEELYVRRGYLIAGSDRRAIAPDIKNISVGNFLSARLASIASTSNTAVPSNAGTKITSEFQALQWAESLTGNPNIRKGSVEHARLQLADWMDSIEVFFKKPPEFPAAFMTVRFWRELNSTKSYALNLKPILHSLRAGSFTLEEAMEHVARYFGSDVERLLKWKQSLDNLSGLVRWMPSFLHAQDYLRAAFPLGQEKIDRLRLSLLQSLADTYPFLEPKARDEFDSRFFEFKKNYLELYFSIHEDFFQIISESTAESKIDPVALRNLDLLTGLQHTDKSYLNRVNILAKWVQRNKCGLPLRKILDRYPRCYCNFNPLANQQPAGMGPRINAAIQEGIDYYRTILRNCRDLIREELKIQQVEESVSRQMDLILSQNPISALKPQSIEVLNSIISKHSREFLLVIRNFPSNQVDGR